jgi:hypothetical protein
MVFINSSIVPNETAGKTNWNLDISCFVTICNHGVQEKLMKRMILGFP